MTSNYWWTEKQQISASIQTMYNYIENTASNINRIRFQYMTWMLINNNAVQWKKIAWTTHIPTIMQKCHTRHTGTASLELNTNSYKIKTSQNTVCISYAKCTMEYWGYCTNENNNESCTEWTMIGKLKAIIAFFFHSLAILQDHKTYSFKMHNM